MARRRNKGKTKTDGVAGRSDAGKDGSRESSADRNGKKTIEPTLAPHGRVAGWAVVGLLLTAFAVNSLFAYRHMDQLRPVHPGQMARDFDLPTLDGNRVRLSDLRGRVVLLIFWSIYCGVCHKELAVLNRVRKDFEGKAVTILAVHAGDASKVDIEDTATNKLGLKMPVVLDDGRAANFYRVRQFPQLVLVGRRGQVLDVWSGYTSRSVLSSALRRALGSR